MKPFKQRFLKISFAISISAVFAFLSFKEADFTNIYRLILSAEYFYVIASFMTLLIAQILRSIRWGLMLHPIQPLSQKIVFPISSIGFMFIILLPARLGELARPYLLHQNSKINISTAMATIVLERILDIIFILTFFVVIISYIQLPSWIVQGALFILISVIAIIVFLFLGAVKCVNYHFDRVANKFLPEKFAKLVKMIREKFYEGMALLGKGRYTLLIVFLSACVWGVFVLSNLFLFKAFQIQAGSFAALTVLTLTALGISIPAAPGFIGNFHFFCILGLSTFGIGKDLALSYAFVNHALIVITFTFLGLICMNLPGLNLGFKLNSACHT